MPPAPEAAFIDVAAKVAPALDKLSGDVCQTGDRHAIARCAALLERCRGELGDVLHTMKRALPPLTPRGPNGKRVGGFEADGLGWVRIASGDNVRAYRKHDLRSRAVAIMADEAELLYDPVSGEMRPPAAIITRVLDRFDAFFGLGNPKTTEFKKHGIAIKEYAEVTPDHPTVQLPGERR